MFTTFFATLFAVLLLSSVAYADIGPKPSVTVEFSGLEEETYYATLLSKEALGSGPGFDVWDGTEEDILFSAEEGGRAIWEKFAFYKDEDGYCFIQLNIWDCTDMHKLRWGYMPPDDFKVLIYFPDTDTFAVSKICHSYAMDSYFSARLNENDVLTVRNPEAWGGGFAGPHGADHRH